MVIIIQQGLLSCSTLSPAPASRRVEVRLPPQNDGRAGCLIWLCNYTVMQSVSKSPLTRDLKIFSFLGWIFQLQPFLCFQPLPCCFQLWEFLRMLNQLKDLTWINFQSLCLFKSRLEFGKRTRSEISLSE